MDRNEIRLQLAMANPGKSTWELDELARWVEDVPKLSSLATESTPEWRLTWEMANVAKLIGEETMLKTLSTPAGNVITTTSHDLFVILSEVDSFYAKRHSHR